MRSPSNITEATLSIAGLKPSAAWERIGRYAQVPVGRGADAWLGIHFRLWKSHGATPLWLVYSQTSYGRAQEVRPLIEPWAADRGILCVDDGGGVAIALDLPPGEEQPGVVRHLADRLKAVAAVLAALPPKPAGTPEPEQGEA